MEIPQVTRDLGKDIELDITNLEQNCAELPTNIRYWYDIQAEAKAYLDFLLNKEKYVKGICTSEIRDSYDKIAANAIEPKLDVHPDIVQLREEILQAKKLKDILDGAVATMDVTRRELDNLVTLYVKNYKNNSTMSAEQEVLKNLNK